MSRYYTVLLCVSLCLLAHPHAYSADWLFPFPINYLGSTVGDIDAFSDGKTISKVHTIQLNTLIGSALTSEVSGKLSSYKDTFISVETLKEWGVLLSFSSSDMSISLSFVQDARKEQALSFSAPYSPPIYSTSAFFTNINNFNFGLSDTRGVETQNEEQKWNIEWFSTGNFAGARGVNYKLSGYFDDGTSEEQTFYRGDISAFIDRAETPYRVTFGDQVNSTSGHLPSQQFGGIGFERNYSALQPNRSIQVGGTQALVLEESADIELYINGSYVTEFRLPPGRYMLDNLPLSSGSNDVRLDIEYQSGRRDSILYSVFYNSKLLKEGISDFGVYLGAPSEIKDSHYRYDTESLITSAYYDYGLTEYLTLGLNGFYHKDGFILGGISTFGTPIGNIGFRLSGSQSSEYDETGYIASIDYAASLWDQNNYSAPNLRIALESYDTYSYQPWTEEGTTGHSAAVSYTLGITDDVYLSLSYNLDKQSGYDTEWSAEASTSWSYSNVVVGLGVTHEEDPNEGISNTEGIVSVDWTWSSDGGQYTADAGYASDTEILRASFSKPSKNQVGQYGYSLSADVESNQGQYQLRGDYIGNRVRYDGDINYYNSNSTEDTVVTSFRPSTAFTISDSNLSWSRPIYGAAAVVQVHESLESDALINSDEDAYAEAISQQGYPNAISLSTAHITQSFTVDAPNAPVGYDIGNYLYNITPGAYTSHLITVGSNKSKTIIGKLLLANGQPLALTQGYLTDLDDTSYPFFTNKGGRFVIEGIGSGDYRIETINSNATGIISIPESDDNLLRLSDIQLEQGANNVQSNSNEKN
ncbi:pilus assembly protein PapC [Vibrio cyclitrophicus]|uniref:Pilus assembly protein PapC n=1 Tax=Vibrio cyclitrophicus TaxID=47951 RepID=A0A7Z1MEW4_9VIBR|nr:pilus assembly protein PapC [Vibrio cyclitrophicus]PMJ58612.1 pilus assembly protein PapC [Vibrio cyclitrophicus]PMP16097.1 pilus assembly protein PapC [Vibrio cyclitrophicus]PMP24067.1 pilus assembly protein PapC [Vibrio cyclitrophicus]